MECIDSHAHLTFPDFVPDLSGVLERARRAGVALIHTIGTTLDERAALQALTGLHPELLFSLGIHPHHVNQTDCSPEAIRAALAASGAIGVGETGLDFHYHHGEPGQQERSFRHHLQVARELDLPIILHTREAEARTRAILEEEGGERGVVHCFTGTPDFARFALDRGLYLSFSGILTFKGAGELRQVAAMAPLDRILVETDAPYLAPIPHRGRRNEPAFVVETIRALAATRGEDPQRIAQATSANFRALFRLDSPARETLAYVIGSGIYLNITKACTLKCAFCPKWSRPVVHAYDLTLTRNPTAREVLDALGDPSPYDEVVFCGFGEPTLRLPVLLEVAENIKQRYGKRVRVNTDGLANLVFGRDVTPQFAGRVDAVSISLNAQNEALYQRHCRPALAGSYAAMLDFVHKIRAHVPEVTVSAIDGLEGVDIQACQRIAEELGVRFRVRRLNLVG